MVTKSTNQRFINKTSNTDNTTLQQFGLQSASDYGNNDETLLGPFLEHSRQQW